MDPAYLNLLRSAFEQYLGALDGPLVPDDHPLPYDFPYITEAKWRFLADAMIQDELREFTNRLHDWRDMLKRWQAWNIVVSVKEEMPAWDLRREFMEPLMHTCLMMPSALRDLATFVGTNALHQVRIHTEASYLDTLEGDPSSAVPAPRPLTRRQKETRLARLAAPLQGSDQFMSSLRHMDDETYRTRTKDYRNLNSHAIGPRIALGHTRMVTRQAVPATRMESQPNGTGRLVEVPGRYVASYSFGGLEPLDLEVARIANLEQYTASRQCFTFFTSLLKVHCAKLPRADA
jgi:hypothetical protein